MTEEQKRRAIEAFKQLLEEENIELEVRKISFENESYRSQLVLRIIVE